MRKNFNPLVVDSLDVMDMNAPRCCGRDMSVIAENDKFWEIYCDTCRDVVYIRKSHRSRPHMMDD